MRSFGWVRRALLALAVAGFAIGTGEFVMLGLLPQVAADLAISIPQAGELIAAYALGVVVGAPLLTAVTVRHRRRRVLVILISLYALGNFASALAPTFHLELAARFISGLPHGAFFGVGAVVAGGMVEAGRRTTAMSVMIAGLTVANIIGVPATTWLGQVSSWRLVYALVGVVAIVAAVLIALLVPDSPGQPGGLRNELGAFARPQVWLTLSITTIGGAGLFATFSYIAPLLTDVAGYASSSVTWLLVLFGLGMTVGNLVGARLADRWMMRTLVVALSLEAVVALVFVVGAHNKIAAAALMFLFPATALGGLPSLQSRIITLAGGAPNLAAASIQAAFNIANSIGAYLGGAVIAAGFGFASTNYVAAGLVVIGLMLAFASIGFDRRARAAGGTSADVDGDSADTAPADANVSDRPVPATR